jgi:uncharacterized membrane protein YkvA (DUF1232 family)
MKYSQLNKIIAQTGLSPERLHEAFGVSNMTIRRWASVPGDQKLTVSQERTVIEGIYRLIADGILRSDSEIVQNILKASTSNSFEAVLKDMGVVAGEDPTKQSYKDRISMMLFQIGSNQEHRQVVDGETKRLGVLQKMGEDWKVYISSLIKVIKTSEISFIDKLVAYGALFYLISPADLIPDSIPVVGYIDDYGFLALAVAYYIAKFPSIIGKIPRVKTSR